MKDYFDPKDATMGMIVTGSFMLLLALVAAAW